MNHRERPGQRSACNRCHGQKLRCIRGPPPNGACQRCIKARETCQYSPALRQGRPTSKQESKYGANDNGAKAQTNSALITATEDHGRRGADHVIDFSALGFPRGPIGDGQGIEAHVFATRAQDFPADSAVGQLQYVDRTASSKSELPAFILDDQFMQDWGPVLDPHTDDASNSARAGTRDVLQDVFPDDQSAMNQSPRQPDTQKDAQRRLSGLLNSLYESPSATMSDAGRGRQLNLQLIVETVEAAHTLLSIIDSSLKAVETTASEPLCLGDGGDGAAAFVDADTVFLIAACYSRIFRNGNALAVVLHDAVSSNDMGALQSMPSIKAGSLAPFPTTSPAIQSALWVQLLRQSLRELEKRLLALSRSNGASTPPGQALSPFPLNKSHVADLASSIDKDVARLEAGVNDLLKTTLDMLRYESI
ncbi:hypothetical protein BJ166DRAFT_619849 [Pestalotiopsis sp. NC0098]|nr:hypothetical protein BJ166DRAFT_619849 [Pestalotiopsis sp. NC0098]